MAKDTVRKIQRLLTQFSGENPFISDSGVIEVKSVYRSPHNHKRICLRLSDDTFTLLDNDGEIARIDGIGVCGRYSTNVWEAVAALRAHDLITQEEAYDFRCWLHKKAADDYATEKVPLLKKLAEQLGFDLVKKKKKRGAA
jgi:hypothetical protein